MTKTRISWPQERGQTTTKLDIVEIQICTCGFNWLPAESVLQLSWALLPFDEDTGIYICSHRQFPEDPILTPHPQPQNSQVRIYCLAPGLELAILTEENLVRTKNCCHCSFQNFHSFTKGNQVSLVRIHFSHPRIGRKIPGCWGRGVESGSWNFLKIQFSTCSFKESEGQEWGVGSVVVGSAFGAPQIFAPNRSETLQNGCGFFAYSWKLLAYSGAFCLQLTVLAFLLTVGAFFLAALASLFTVGAFLLTVGNCV